MNDEELRILFVDIFKRLDRLEKKVKDLEIRHRNLVINLDAIDY